MIRIKYFLIVALTFMSAYGDRNPSARQILTPSWTLGSEDRPVQWMTLGLDALYLFGQTGELRKIAPGNGAELAGYDLGLEPLAQPITDGIRIFTATAAGNIVAIDPATGKTLWSHPAGTSALSDFGLQGNVLSFAANDPIRAVVSLRTADATVVSCIPFNGRILSAPLMIGEELIFGTTGGVLYRHALTNGLLLDSLKTRGEFVHQKITAASDKLLLTACGDHKKSFCLTRASGLSAPETWSMDFARPFYPDADAMSAILLSRPQAREKLLGDMLSRLHAETPSLALDTAFLPAGPVYFSGFVTRGDEAAFLVREPDGLARALYHVILLKISDGTVLFHAQFRDEDLPYLYCPEPLFNEDFVVAQIGRDRIVGLARSTGALTFEYRAASEIASPLLRADNTLFCLTQSGVVTALALDDREQSPMTFSLAPNTPNPFNPATTLRFQLPVRAKVQFKIFNARGQIIVTLADEVREPGRYKAVWKGTDHAGREVPSGIYFAVLNAGPYKKTIKMTMTK